MKAAKKQLPSVLALVHGTLVFSAHGGYLLYALMFPLLSSTGRECVCVCVPVHMCLSV